MSDCFLIPAEGAQVTMVLLWRWAALGALLALLCTSPCRANTEEDAARHQGHQAQGAAQQNGKVGLDERLGSKIPLDLKLKDETGRERTLAELVTGPTIILPVYYACTNVCNFMQEGMARVLPEIKLEPGKDYRVISISFDETETPERAAKSRRMYEAAMKGKFPKGNWHFLTGDAANIRRLTEAAGYSFQRQGIDFVHPVASFVVAGDGKIVRYLYGTRFLPKDVTLALVEARQGKVGTTVSKMVKYCFSFDPKSKSYQFNLLRVSATVIIVCVLSFLAYLVFGGKKKSTNQPRGNS